MDIVKALADLRADLNVKDKVTRVADRDKLRDKLRSILAI